MRPDKRNKPSATLLALALPVIWFGLICGSVAAPGQNAAEWLDAMMLAINDPMHIVITPYSVKAVLMVLLIYATCVLLYIDSQGNRRPDVEYGSARWGNPKQLCAKYRYHISVIQYIKDMCDKLRRGGVNHANRSK